MRFSLLLFLPFLAQALEPQIRNLAPSIGVNLADYRPLDVDGDGDIDIVGTIGRFDPNSQVVWKENLGTNGYAPLRTFHYSESGSLPPRFFDLDGDGQLELARIIENDGTYSLQVSFPLKDGQQSNFQTFREGPKFLELVELEAEAKLTLATFHSNPTDADEPSLTFATLVPDVILDPWPEIEFNLPETGDILELRSADLDGDGDLDLIVDTRSEVLAIERTGPRSFSAETVVIESGNFDFFNRSLELLVDMDGDGDLDLASSTLRYFHKDGGEFSFTKVDLPVLESASSLDFDIKKGKDLIVSEDLDSDILAEKIVHYFFNEEGEWQVVRTTSFNTENLSDFDVHPGDYNSDGITDLIVSAAEASWVFAIPAPEKLRLFLGTTDGYEEAQGITDEDPIDYNIHAVGDFDSDGDPDIFYGPDSQGLGYFLQNDGAGNFTHSTQTTLLFPEGFTFDDLLVFSLKPVLLDDDDHLDLAITYTRSTLFPSINESSACTVMKGRGDGTFERSELSEEAFGEVPVEFCPVTQFVDWDNDGDLDGIVRGGWRENIDGELSQTMRPILVTPASSDPFDPFFSRLVQDHTTGDINGDGFPDYLSFSALAGENFGPGSLGVAFNDGNGEITEISYFKNEVRAPMTTFDIDGDGRDEIIFQRQSTPSSSGLFSRPNFAFLSTPDGSPRDLQNGVVTALPAFRSLPTLKIDINGDGIMDLATNERFLSRGEELKIKNLPNLLKRYHLPRQGFSLRTSFIADFDSDGDGDFLISGNFQGLHLIKNRTFDSRNPITAALLANNIEGFNATPRGDADNDGISNLDEYLAGTDPLAADDAVGRVLDLASERTPESFTLAFPRRKDASDFLLEYQLERSTDLISWEPAPLDEATITEIDERWENVSVEGLTEAALYFYRTLPIHTP